MNHEFSNTEQGINEQLNFNDFNDVNKLDGQIRRKEKSTCVDTRN